MYEILATNCEFNEHVVGRRNTEDEARICARAYYDKYASQLIRTYWRPAITILATHFYETEQQVISYAITELLKQKVYLDGNNLSGEVERLLVDQIDSIAWADPELLGDAIMKLKGMSIGKQQQLLREFCNDNR